MKLCDRNRLATYKETGNWKVLQNEHSLGIAQPPRGGRKRCEDELLLLKPHS